MSSQRNCIITVWSVESETPPQASRQPGPKRKVAKEEPWKLFKEGSSKDWDHLQGTGRVKNDLDCPPADGDNDPLKWWKVHEVNCPQVSHLAKK